MVQYVLHGALKEAGIRVHGWIAMNMNQRLAGRHPDWAMKDGFGKTSPLWLSPSHPDVRSHQRQAVLDLLKEYDLDGIHLDYIRYPDIQHDFSSHALERFEASSGVSNATPEQILSDHYETWTEWRANEITGQVVEIEDAVRLRYGNTVILSAALIGDAATHYRSREIFGQDYGMLAQPLDLVLPMAYYPLDRRSPDWVEQVLFRTRASVGDTPVLVGLATFQEPDEWTLSVPEFERALEMAQRGSEGIAFYSYAALFGRRDDARNVPPDVLAAVRRIAGSNDTPSYLSLPHGGTATWLALGAATAALATGGLFIRRRRRRYTAAPTGVATPDVAGDASVPMPSLDWQEYARLVEAEHLDGKSCLAISNLMRARSPKELEEQRLLYVLHMIGTLGALSAWDGMGHDRFISRLAVARQIEEAIQLGWVEMNNGRLRLTESGTTELARARAEGFDPDHWRFVEQRINETLSGECPKCGAVNLFHYFWPLFECRECGASVKVGDLALVQITRSGDMPAQGLKDYASCFRPMPMTRRSITSGNDLSGSVLSCPRDPCSCLSAAHLQSGFTSLAKAIHPPQIRSLNLRRRVPRAWGSRFHSEVCPVPR